MNEQAQDGAGRGREWARTVVSDLGSAEAAERALTGALGPHPGLQAENSVRRAYAVHAAAMGMGPAGCAAAAGISETLLTHWRDRDPAFETALTSARALAESHAVAGQGKVSGFGLGVLLRAVGRGMHAGVAASVVGLRPDQLLRLRRTNPQVGALVEAAVQQARGLRGSERKPKRAPAYRLVTVGEPDPEPAPGPGPEEST
ncbi:hypothetical protein ACIRP0_21530 [Streptomyces sp. NPDC101733]|uniref:hypothetical protein n=1 Tax=unclassified Streptomyces TaxID=2593676 RepID=UPI00381B561B